MVGVTAIPWILLQNFVNAITYVKRSPWVSSTDQPDLLKTYPGKDYLFASRIFKPREHLDTKRRLPLVIRIHGGGFIMNSPASDDTLARFLADNALCVVISMDYRKAPRNPFPAAYEDLVELTIAAIEDPDLGIDPRKVILCGSSSGGNLALTVAQDTRLRSKIRGVIACTPVTDFVTPLEDKIATRPDPTVPDFLQSMYNGMIWQYTGGVNVSLEDVRISPCYFKNRADLPERAFFIGAEHDLLCREAEDMAEKLAQGLEKQSTERGWEAGGVEWALIKGQKHRFEATPAKDLDEEATRLADVRFLYQAMADWVHAVCDHA